MHGNMFAVTENIKQSSKVLNRTKQLHYLLDKYQDSFQRDSLKLYGAYFNGYNSRLVSLFTLLVQEKFYEKAFKNISQEALANCKDTFCLADLVFGNGLGIYYLYILDRYNINLSPYEYKKRANDELARDEMYLSLYTEEELQAFVVSLSLIPDAYFESFRNKEGKKIQAYDKDKRTVLANSRMHFYTPWALDSSVEQISTILHEIAHNVANMTYADADNNNIWNAFSKWFKTTEDGRKVWKYTGENFVSNYARTSPIEDFAESFTAYVINPSFLKEKAPKKYEYIKDKIFLGEEYLGSVEGKDQIASALKKIDEAVENFNEDNIKSLKISCFENFLDFALVKDKHPFYKCVLRDLTDRGGVLSPVYQSQIVYDHLKASNIFETIILSMIDRLEVALKRDLDKNRIEMCNESIFMLFDFDSYIFSSWSKWRLQENGKHLCRWINIRTRIKEQQVDEKSFKENLKEVLLLRVKE
jgi:hypothetical protein